jgi:hypothetical protein
LGIGPNPQSPIPKNMKFKNPKSFLISNKN